MFEALQDGLIQTSTMLPDWNSPDLAKQAIAWPSPPVVREKDKDLSMRMIGNVPHVQDTSSLALMDAEKRLKHGLVSICKAVPSTDLMGHRKTVKIKIEWKVLRT